MLVYIMSLPGGMIADKLLGQYKQFFRAVKVLCRTRCFSIDRYLSILYRISGFGNIRGLVYCLGPFQRWSEGYPRRVEY
jgi:dipeptide/tripeptide permease